VRLRIYIQELYSVVDGHKPYPTHCDTLYQPRRDASCNELPPAIEIANMPLRRLRHQAKVAAENVAKQNPIIKFLYLSGMKAYPVNPTAVVGA